MARTATDKPKAGAIRPSPQRSEADPGFRRWLVDKGADGQLFISAMTVAEIVRGTRKLERKGAMHKAGLLQVWLDGLSSTFSDRILPMGRVVASIAGRIEADAVANGFDPELADVIIAATAQAHDLVVVTENLNSQPLHILINTDTNS